MLELETIPTLLHMIWIVLSKYTEINLVRILTLVFKYIIHYDVGTAGAAAVRKCSTGAVSSIMLFSTPNIFHSNKGFFYGRNFIFQTKCSKSIKNATKAVFFVFVWMTLQIANLFVCLFIYLFSIIYKGILYFSSCFEILQKALNTQMLISLFPAWSFCNIPNFHYLGMVRAIRPNWTNVPFQRKC